MVTQISTRDHARLKICKDPRVWLILLAVCEKNIVRYFLLIVSMIPLVGTFLSTFILHGAYILLILDLFRQQKIRISLSDIGVFAFVLFALLFTIIIYPQNAQYIFDANNFWNTIFPCLRFYFVGIAFSADRKTMDLVGKASCYAIIAEIAFVLVYMMPRGLMGSDDMSRSYQLLPNVLFAVNYAFRGKSVLKWIISISGSAFLLAMGSRGPIAILLVYVFIRFIQTVSTKKAIKIIMMILIGLTGIVILSSNVYSTVLMSARIIFQQFGFSTRIIDLALAQETISHTSGRDAIYELVLSKIAERPLLGYGIYGEWQWVGWSAHNLYLELLVHYGIPLGALIIIWIVKTIIGTYFKTQNNYAKEFILIWACYIFIRGIFGGAYLEYGMFFAIGFCLSEMYRIKKDSLYFGSNIRRRKSI